MTPVGQSLYYYAHSILSQFDEIERLKKTYHAVVETRLLVSTAMLLLQDVDRAGLFQSGSQRSRGH